MSTVLVREIVQLVQPEYDGWRSNTGIHRNSGLKRPRRVDQILALRPHKQAFAIILSPDILSDIYIKYGLSFYQRI